MKTENQVFLSLRPSKWWDGTPDGTPDGTLQCRLIHRSSDHGGIPTYQSKMEEKREGKDVTHL